MSHTPGPWKITDGDQARPKIVSDNNTPVVAVFCGDYDSEPGWEISEEDARLIASAPDLLEACKEVMQYFTSMNDIPVERATIKTNSDTIKKMKQAIAKAEGEEK